MLNSNPKTYKFLSKNHDQLLRILKIKLTKQNGLKPIVDCLNYTSHECDDLSMDNRLYK